MIVAPGVAETPILSGAQGGIRLSPVGAVMLSGAAGGHFRHELGRPAGLADDISVVLVADAFRHHAEGGDAVRVRRGAGVPPFLTEVALTVDQDAFAATVEPSFEGLAGAGYVFVLLHTVRQGRRAGQRLRPGCPVPLGCFRGRPVVMLGPLGSADSSAAGLGAECGWILQQPGRNSKPNVVRESWAVLGASGFFGVRRFPAIFGGLGSARGWCVSHVRLRFRGKFGA